METSNVTGKVVVITGASSGIGVKATESAREEAPILRWRQKKIILDVPPLEARILGFFNLWYKPARLCVRTFEQQHVSARYSSTARARLSRHRDDLRQALPQSARRGVSQDSAQSL